MDVVDRGVFAQAGLREGDRIVSVNGQPVTTEGQLVQMLTQPAAGAQALNIAVMRGTQQQMVAVQPAALVQGIAAFDPLYQAGLILNDRIPDRLVVARVFPRTPAYYAGIRAGDVLTSMNGSPLVSLDNLTQVLQTAGGNVLTLQVDRLGQTRQLSLGAGEGSIRSAMRPTLNANAEVAAGQRSAIVTPNGVSGRTPDVPRTSAGTGSTTPARAAARETAKTTSGGVIGAGGTPGSSLTNPPAVAAQEAAAQRANVGIPPQNLPQGAQLVNPNPANPAQGTIIANPSVVPGAAPLGTVPGTQGTNPGAPGGTTPGTGGGASAPIGTAPGTGAPGGTGAGGTGAGGSGT
jgi:membrane-associated protease RseP (regulator of RpoE activity)